MPFRKISLFSSLISERIRLAVFNQYNLYASVGNDPVNLIDLLGMYKCGGNLSEGQCEQFEVAKDQAIGKLETRLGTLEGAKNALVDGGSLSDAQNEALSDLNTFLGTKGEGLEGIETALNLGNEILGELKGDKPALLVENTDSARITHGRRVISLGQKFFASGSLSQQFTLVHEGVHTSKVAPNDFSVNLHGGGTIGPYGIRNAITRGQRVPSKTIRHADSIAYGLGFRRNGGR